MAADFPVKNSPENSCCTEWKKKCAKLERGRQLLKQAVQILNEQVDKIQADNVALKKAYEAEQARADTEKMEKEKEVAMRVSVEDEISVLKSEISSLTQKGSADTEDKKGEVKLLQDRLLISEKEITRFKALLEKEKRRADSEKKNAEAQKKSAVEAWKHMKAEKDKADEERQRANFEGKKSEEYRLQVEELRKEVEEMKSKLASEMLKCVEAGKKLEAEKCKVRKERKHADAEMARAEEQKRLAEANEKKVMEEKSHAENLSHLLEDAKRTIKELQEKNVPSRNLDGSPGYQQDLDETSAFNSEISFVKQRRTANIDHKTSEKEINQPKDLSKKEKERAGSAEKSAAEAWKCMEVEKVKVDEEKKNANNENKTNKKSKIQKSHADKLSFQLEQNGLIIMELQKQMHELLSSRKSIESSTISPSKDVDTVLRKLKHVKKKMKLEKMRLKYAKQVANVEKNRSSILQQELGRIKLDSLQISRRLDALDKWFSFGIEYREDLEKEGLSASMHRSKLKRKLCDLEQSQIFALTESEHKFGCMAMAASGALRQTHHCTDPLLQICEGNHTETVSANDSKLKSLHGGSYQKVVQSSVTNSCSSSFTDDQLLGSQEKGAFVSTSDKWAEANGDGQITSSTSDEATKIRRNGNPAVVAENGFGLRHHIDAFGRANENGRKFKRMCDAIESLKFLCSEGRNLHVQMEEKLSILHCLLNREMDKPLEELKHVEGSSFANPEKGRKRRRLSHDEQTIMKQLHSPDEQDKTQQIGNEVCNDANGNRHASASAIKLLGTPQEFIKGLMDCYGGDLESMNRVDEVENQDYMKLLDLDDAADEERYRKAMEMPLSPSLPEVEISSAEIFDMDMSRIDDSFLGGSPNEKKILMPSHSFDIVDVDIHSNNLRCNAFKTSCDELQGENQCFCDSFDSTDKENGCCHIVDAERASHRQTKDSEAVELSNTPSSGDDCQMPSNISSESKLGSKHGNFPAYCVVFSDTKDTGSISRIFSAVRIGMDCCSVNCEREFIVRKILHVLKMEEKLLPKEKACTFFTLLLLNFYSWILGKCGRCWDKDFVLSLDSFSGKFNAEMSDFEARNLFTELCFLDELLGLIEDFLINGQVVSSAEVSSETLSECDARMNIFLDGVHISLSSKSASAEQLVAGSTVLSSICKAVDYIEFICQASYNLLQSRKYDNDVLLTILHVFASICGKRFFTLEECSLTMSVVKSIIIFLERGNSSAVSASSLHEVKSKFHPCAECPFDAVSMDVVVSMLLEKLHIHALSVTKHQHQMEGANLSNSLVLYHKLNSKQSLNNEVVAHKADSNSFCGGTSYDLSDILSLVELLACYMSWEWTCGKIIPVLLEILERPVLDEVAVAVVVLLGQLGRLGVAACGCEDKEVENLKSKLCGFVWQDSRMRTSLPVQIATVASLLGLTTLDIEDVIHSDKKVLEVASHSCVLDAIKKWYSSLSEEQKSLSFDLLQSTVVKN